MSAKALSPIQVELAEIRLPDFGEPTVEPGIGRSEYEARLQALRDCAGQRGLDILLIYADREHMANLAFLTGFDPRFEEALLILNGTKLPVLLVGNECWAYSTSSPLQLERRLYQHFSLMGSGPLQEPAAHGDPGRGGIGRGSRVGVVDWKYYGPEVGPDAALWINAPAYLVDVVRELTGQSPANATDLLMNPIDGLRAVNSVDQLACFEFAATCISAAVRRVLLNLQVGMTEFEAIQQAQLNGLPFSMHPILVSGSAHGPGAGQPQRPKAWPRRAILRSIGGVGCAVLPGRLPGT